VKPRLLYSTLTGLHCSRPFAPPAAVALCVAHLRETDCVAEVPVLCERVSVLAC